MKLLFRNADIIAWKDEHFDVIKKGCLGIDGDTICYVGKSMPSDKYDIVRDVQGRLLMPGLVNCHCHAAMVLLRGIGSDMPLDKWLFEMMFPTEDYMHPADIAAGNKLAMMEMLASGVTSFNDSYMVPETAIEANENIGMKMNISLCAECVGPNSDKSYSKRTDKSLELFDLYNGTQNGRVKIAFDIHAEYTINQAIAADYARQIQPYKDKGALMQIHLSETQKEVNECITRRGCTPVEWFESLGVFNLPTAAAHCVAVSKKDLEIIKRNGVSPVHCPTSNMKLGSGFAPVREMIDMGINVGLGTDGAASNNNLNMFEEMHIASIIHNGYQKDSTILPSETILKMATVNGARIQGRYDTGCIEVGKKADIIAIDMRNKPHLLPRFDVISLLVYSAQASDVCMTMVDGKILYENGEYYTIDTEKLYAESRIAITHVFYDKEKFFYTFD